jgi:hypothetical protein
MRKKGCPILFDILNEINPSKALTLVKVRYPFGSIIIQNDTLHLPINQTTTVPITDPRIDKKWKNLLGYRSIPTGMITENSVEIYREMNEKVFSVALSGPNTGLEIGIVENFGTTAAYTVSAGARSLYMLPKISKANSHKKLKKEFSLTNPPPNKLLDHWHIFKELYSSEAFESSWNCELIFLTDSWMREIDSNDLAWLKLKCYIQKKAWEHSKLGRRKVILDVVWEQAANFLCKKSIKVEPYVVDTLKHLIYISLGGISGSRPSNGDNFAGPINEIQRIYMDIYDLGDQIPTIMRPYSFSINEEKPVYYSMQTPMMLSSTPTFRNINSNIEAIRELIQIKSYVFCQNYGNLKIDNTKFNDWIKNIQFNYFHSHSFSYGKDIRPTTEIPLNDEDWFYKPYKKANLKFSDNGLYIRGCVKISKQKEEIE